MQLGQSLMSAVGFAIGAWEICMILIILAIVLAVGIVIVKIGSRHRKSPEQDSQ